MRHCVRLSVAIVAQRHTDYINTESIETKDSGTGDERRELK